MLEPWREAARAHLEQPWTQPRARTIFTVLSVVTSLPFGTLHGIDTSLSRRPAKAAHRFFSNGEIKEANILACRFQATLERFASTASPHT